MLRLLTLLCLALALPAADRWLEFRSGPFEVLTDAGRARRARPAGAARAVPLRRRAGPRATGPPAGLADSRSGLPFGEGGQAGAIPAEGPLPRTFLRESARILIEATPAQTPRGDGERLGGFVLYPRKSPATTITLGAPLPPAERNRNWAKMHMLTVPPDYFGKLRVLVSNLWRGAEAEPAYRNAFAKSPAEIDKEADAYFRAGNYATTLLRSRTMLPEKDFAAKPVDPPGPAEAASARASLESARLEPDPGKALAALEKAAKLNPRWAEPLVEMARREPVAGRRIQLLAAAAKLEPRNAAYWRALAEAQEAERQFVEAAKSWASAELAAATPEERERLRQIRIAADVRRRKQEEAEKKRQADAEAAGTRAAQSRKSMASIQAALDKAHREHPASPSSGKVEPWWEGPRPHGKLQGLLRQVDCLGKQARLVIEAQDRKLTRLLVRDPKQLVIVGGGEATFGCGPQNPPRRIVVEYFPKPDAKLGTAGRSGRDRVSLSEESRSAALGGDRCLRPVHPS